MRVYVKKEDKNTMIPGIIVTIVFLFVSVGIFIAFFKSEKSFVDALASFGITLLFAVIFFGFSIYFIYALIKRPKGYKAKLIDKKIENYNGKQISYMIFNIQKKKDQEEDFISSQYKCYTIGANNLIIEKDYSLKIKEFNWEPKYVEEYQSNEKNKVANKIPNFNMPIVFSSVGLIFGALLLICILGIIMYPNYALTYIIIAILSVVAVLSTFKSHKTWKLDNNLIQSKKDLKQELEKIKPIDNKQKKVGNIIIKNLLILLIIYPIIWLIVVLNINLEKEEFIIVYSMILFVELPLIGMLLYNIGYDERLIKRCKVNIVENINIATIKSFIIFRPTKSTSSSSQYFIVDQNKNLILKIKKSNFIGNRFVLCNPQNIIIGEINIKLFSLTNEFVVNILNEKPFIIRSKMQLHSNYQVIGRNYHVKGDTHLIRNIIYDNQDNEIAFISAISKNSNNWHELGNTEVILNNNLNNSIDIIIIALCITMGNFQTFDERMNR